MHTEPELLGLLALGEPVGTEEDRRHLAACAECAGELAALARVAGLGRAGGVDPIDVPAVGVWGRIRDELGLSPGLAPVPAPAPDRPGRAELGPVGDGWSHAYGLAELATDERGRRVLQLALSADLPASGVRQAWLVHRGDPTQRQTIGILDGLHGVWTIDHAIDLEDWAILEVSQQNPGESVWSGESIVRGELTLGS